ncbi:hypothetical protein [Microbacterium sp. 22242]|uniref:hypothetical protein n=1 Tax=Microbacterium sp. 22242 TaxID=3453896 RepID=UPI003F870D6C
MTGEEQERRELERRAYGRDGPGLTAAEAARLTDLRRVPLPDAEPPVPAPASVPEHPSPVPEHPSPVPEHPSPVPEPVEGAPRHPHGPFAGLRLSSWLATGRWRRPRYLIGAVALLLLCGVAVGVAIPRPPDIGLGLRSGEAERRDAIAKGQDYDPGSVELLDRSDSVLLWTATLSHGGYRCAILDAPGLPQQKECQAREQWRQNPYALQAHLDLPAESAEPGRRVAYGGTIFSSGNGLVGGFIMRWEATPQEVNQGMTDEELAASARIAREQHIETLSIAGRWRELVIWRGYADNGSSRCLIVEAPELHKACAANSFTVSSPSDTVEDPSLTIGLPATDTRPSARIELRTPLYAAEYLVIVENADVGDGGLFPSR